MSNNCVLQKFFFDWFCVTTKAKKGILKIQHNNCHLITQQRPKFPPKPPMLNKIFQPILKRLDSPCAFNNIPSWRIFKNSLQFLWSLWWSLLGFIWRFIAFIARFCCTLIVIQTDIYKAIKFLCHSAYKLCILAECGVKANLRSVFK